MWKFILLGCLLLGGCSHSGPSQEVKSFVHNWTQQFKPQDKNYPKVYEQYLATVEETYRNSGAKDKFNSYLESLVNNSQILADQENALPQLYKEKTGRSVASDDQNYKLFITQQMTALYDKLFTARELKIREEVGPELYEDLKDNYQEFVKNENARKYAFPL